MWSKPARRAIALKLLVAKRLNAEAQTIDAGGTEAGQPFWSDRFWVGLERDFRIDREGKRAAACADDCLDLKRFKQRWRTAAEVDGVGRRAVSLRGNLVHQRGDIPLFQLRVEKASIEVAVVADGGTERNVDVEAEHYLSLPAAGYGLWTMGLRLPGARPAARPFQVGFAVLLAGFELGARLTGRPLWQRPARPVLRRCW